LRSFGYQVYFPENHGALIGARRLGADYIPEAVRQGFSPDICSYLTADIGAFLIGETPLGRYGLDEVPRPEVLVYNTSQCREVKEWLSFYANRFDVPLLGIETPRDIDATTDGLKGYLIGQYMDLIRKLSEIRETPFDMDRYRETVASSARTCALWQEILDYGRDDAPALSFFDHILLMAPAVVLRGDPAAETFYETLRDELATQRGSAEHPQIRAFWEGMPVWGKVRFLADLCTELGIRIVASTYCHSWAFDFSGDDPLEATARAYADVFITRSQAVKRRYLARMITTFRIDTVLYHDAKTCPYNTNTRFALPADVEEETGVPYLIFYGDLVDMRHFSEEELRLRLEAFVENLQ